MVTWEPAYPRGCEVFGIKTRNLPSAEVFAATGTHCPAFERIEPSADLGGEAGGEAEEPDSGGIWA